MRILVTGAKGFIGRHLTTALNERGHTLYAFDSDTPREKLEDWCARCDFVYHLAGVQRPPSQEAYMAVNYGFTETLLKTLVRCRNACPVMFASSTQAALSSLYGKSKKAGEELVAQYGRETGAPVYIFRLPEVFGKWARPDQGGVVAAMCYTIARDMPLPYIDPEGVLPLIGVDEAVAALLTLPEGECVREGDFCTAPGGASITAGRLQSLIRSFRELHGTAGVPDLGDVLTRLLYAAYQSYLPTMDLAAVLDMHGEDGSGSQTRFIDTPSSGGVSVNIMHAHVGEGGHWHNLRSERHLVVAGEGVIRIRAQEDDSFTAYPVSGERHTRVEIPAGYVHAVENTGESDLIDLVWASEPFDAANPDTFA